MVAACSASVVGYPIATGICNACLGKAFTADECAAFGRAADCVTVEVTDPSMEGCVNACSFEHCKKTISCGSTGGVPTGPDGPPVPCEPNERGIFTDIPSCDGYEAVLIADQTRYVCRCENGCACGLRCGVIPEVDPVNAIYCTTP